MGTISGISSLLDLLGDMSWDSPGLQIKSEEAEEDNDMPSCSQSVII